MEEEDYWFLELRRVIGDLQLEYCRSRGTYGCRNCDNLRELVRITEGGGVDYDEKRLAGFGIAGENVREILENYVSLLEDRIEKKRTAA